VWRVGLAFLLVLGSPPAAQQRPVTGLTAAPELARVYSAIFDARFADVPHLLTQACGRREPQGAPSASRDGPAPREACQVLDAVGLWWQIQLDPFNRTRDAGFQSRVEAAIAAAEAWTAREPERAEAWFYLGGAYGARVQWRVLRGARLAAARDGRRIKSALERAVALDPSMADAYFGVGLYHYYAAVAPAAARMLRWLLLLPGGDRAKGLEQVRRARGGGLLVRSEADYQLHVLYLWYENQPERALELLAGLIERHPLNPHFRQAAADIHDVYLHDLTASLRSWEALLDAARTGRLGKAGMKLDLGGIAKGYILQQALGALRMAGLGRALVEAGGDVVVGSGPPGLAGWRIAAPGAGEAFRQRASQLTNAALATSGAAEQFVEIDGVRYSHVVDPRTGLGLTSQVTARVIARDAATADALATALTVLGPDGVAAIQEKYSDVLISLSARD
jgi:hypothetical protein